MCLMYEKCVSRRENTCLQGFFGRRGAMNRTELDGLLRLIAKGDNSAFEDFYLRTKNGVYAFLYTYFHNAADTEDAMQCVYLKIKMNIHGYLFGSNPSAWILQIAKHHALNELRRRRKELVSDEAVALHSAETVAFTDGITDVMQQTLTEEEQRIVTLHVLWQYKHREIAEILGCPTGTVTSKYKRAIKKMQDALKEVAE